MNSNTLTKLSRSFIIAFGLYIVFSILTSLLNLQYPFFDCNPTHQNCNPSYLATAIFLPILFALSVGNAVRKSLLSLGENLATLSGILTAMILLTLFVHPLNESFKRTTLYKNHEKSVQNLKVYLLDQTNYFGISIVVGFILFLISLEVIPDPGGGELSGLVPLYGALNITKFSIPVTFWGLNLRNFSREESHSIWKWLGYVIIPSIPVLILAIMFILDL